MAMHSNILLCILVLLLTFNSISSQDCFPEYPFMSVGDVNLTQSNIEKEILDRRYLLVQVTSSECDTCCRAEPHLASFVNNTLRSTESNLKGYNIQVGRVDIAKEPWFASKFNVPHVPFNMFFKNGKAYHFLQEKNSALNSINIGKIINPFHVLQTPKQFETFINSFQADKQGRILFRTKVFAMFDSPDTYDEIVSNFFEAAEEMIWRLDVSFGLVTDKEVLKAIWKTFGKKFFDEEYDKNSLIVYTHKNRFEREDDIQKADVEGGSIQNYKLWIGQAATRQVDEYTALNQVSYQTTAPVLIIFLNIEDEYGSEKYLEEMRKVAAEYPYSQAAHFAWVDAEENKSFMKNMGVYGRK